MNAYLQLLIVAVILIAVGVFLYYYAGLPYPIEIVGAILVIAGIIVFIFWIVYFVKQFVPP